MDRTAVLIIDSMDVDHMKREVEAGNMPTLAQFLSDSAFHPMRNVVSHRSEMAWAQFLAGAPASELDWYGWWDWFPDQYRTIGTGCAPVTPFYAHDPVETVIADVIQTSAQYNVPGAQLFAYAAHSPQFPRSSVPAGLLNEALDTLGYDRLYNNDHYIGWFDDRYVTDLSNLAVAASARRSEMTEWLCGKAPNWQFLLGCMSEYHDVAHHTWHGVDPTHILHGQPTTEVARDGMAKTITAIDDHIAAFIEIAGPDATVVLGANHGHQQADDILNCVLLPELWYRKTFGGKALQDPDQAAWKRNGMPARSLGRNKEWSRSLRTHFRPSASDIPRALLSHTPRSWYEGMRRLKGGNPNPPRWDLQTDYTREQELDGTTEWYRREDLGREIPHWYRKFWPAMRTFAIPTFDDGRIRVNLKGREANGIVPISEYEKEIAEVADYVQKITDPRTGEPLVREVLFDKLYDPMDPNGPDADVVIRWNRSTDALEHPDVGLIGPHVYQRTSSHREEGWFAVQGAGAPNTTAEDVLAPWQVTAFVDQLRRGNNYDAAIGTARAGAGHERLRVNQLTTPA